MYKAKVIERDGLFTLSSNRNYRCVMKHRGKWVGGTFDASRGQFCDGKNFARGMSAGALSQAYTCTFRSQKAAFAWLQEKE
jgi:hypothetical protein